MSYQFQYTEAIWLLAGVVIFILLFISLNRWKEKTIRRIGDPTLVRDLIKSFSAPKFISKFVLLSAAFAIGVIALMNPRKPAPGEGAARKGIDVAIALDVSKSMLANDITPTRLEKAREFISKLMQKMPDDRFALVLFAGKAYLQMPLTTDHEAIRLFINNADPNSMPMPGTVVSDAMRIGAMAFNSQERRFKTLVIISDGEDHDMASAETANEMAAQGIMINTIGIGSQAGSFILNPETGEQKKDASGNPVWTKLNEEILKQIAAATNGIYIFLDDTDASIAELQQHLSQIEKKAFSDVSLMNFKSYYWWIVAAMFVLVVAEFFITERKKTGI